ncbi:flagellar protein FliS [Tissierella sp. MSJ-40]|uniref:Flagellar protein FliS n=1 Tax=Tissierella simiarum TaxID=2841534 RepID=A0ABS6E2N3_9FIRM|nr:flagellar protein FliS [Tissierella simiarum]MBU5437167.1 flagellar protein FliS [Tissierella simiarum]
MEIDLEKRILAANEWGLVALLHEGLIDNFKEAKKAISEENNELLTLVNNRSRDILTELLVIFRESNELSTNLKEIYIFINKLITEGELKKDINSYNESIKILTPVYEGFKELETKEPPNIISGLTYGKSSLEEHNIKTGKTFQG